jgi:hypothetical protein
MRPALALLLFLPSLAPAEELTLNQIQAIGSHNSYHVAPPPALLEKIRHINAGWAESWNYTHPPLAEQLAMGVRQFELDIFADSKGGLFAEPLGVKLARLSGAKLAFNTGGELSKPGFKILHVPDMDCWSTAPTLKMALEDIRAWSDKNPRHLPVMILLECKDQPQPPLPTKPEAFTRERLVELEQEILSVIPLNRILKPDDIRGDHASLRDAVKKKGWPTVDSLRGKFLFTLDNTDAIRARYLDGNPALEGRLIFASAPEETHPCAAWFKCNDPVREQEKIRRLVKEGFLVRTRADTSKPDPNMKEAAFGSGAQWISTDHFLPASKDRVAFGTATARPNPLTGAAGDQVDP